MADKKKERDEGASALSGVTDKATAETALRDAAYTKSQAVQDAEAQLADYQNNKPGEYVSGYQSRIDALLDQIENRGGFSYDFNADPLYQNYKDRYTHNGRLAMLDTQAAAQAAAGGYGTSYAVSAGNQAYQGYLNDLNGELPDLYEAALARYKAEGSRMQDTLADLTTQEKNAHTAYEDKVADYYKGLSQYSDMADSLSQKDYSAYQDRLDSLTDARDYYAGQEEQSFKNDMSRKDYELALEKYRENIREWEAEQAAAREKWQAQLAEEQSEFAQEMAYKAAAAARKTASAASRGSTVSRRSTTTGSNAASRSTSSGQAANKKKADFLDSSMSTSGGHLKKQEAGR